METAIPVSLKTFDKSRLFRVFSSPRLKPKTVILHCDQEKKKFQGCLSYAQMLWQRVMATFFCLRTVLQAGKTLRQCCGLAMLVAHAEGVKRRGTEEALVGKSWDNTGTMGTKCIRTPRDCVSFPN